MRRRMEPLRRGETVVAHGRALRVTRLTSGTAPRVANRCNEPEVRQQYGVLTRCDRSDAIALRRSRYSSACSFAQRSVRRAHCHTHRGHALRTFASASEPCRVSSDPAHSRLTVTPEFRTAEACSDRRGPARDRTRGASRVPARRTRAVFHWVSHTRETRSDWVPHDGDSRCFTGSRTMEAPGVSLGPARSRLPVFHWVPHDRGSRCFT